MAVPVHRPGPRGRRGSPRRLIRRQSRCHAATCSAPTAGLSPQERDSDHDRADAADAGTDREQPGDPQDAGDRATREGADDRGETRAGREKPLGGAAHPGRSSGGKDGDPADEDSRKPEPLERRDRHEVDRVHRERRQERPEDERDGPEDEQPLRAESSARAVGTSTSAAPRSRPRPPTRSRRVPCRHRGRRSAPNRTR